MTAPAQPKQWINLGLLLGGHTPSHETPPPVSEPRQVPASPAPAPPTNEEREAKETMRAAGYMPKVGYPGSRSTPWPSACATCGAPRRPSLQDVERGIRCKHVRRRSAASGQMSNQAGIQEAVRQHS